MTGRSRSAPLPGAAGSPGLAQGSYGDAGNLELVVPAAEGGFWCYWFNTDPVDHHSGAVRRCWSAGLQVVGPPCSLVRIAQFQAGPAFLEVLAVAGDALVRQHWTPATGFVDDGPVGLDRAVVWCTAPLELAGTAHALAVSVDGQLLHLRACLTDYPQLAWSADVIGSGVATAELVGSAAGLVCSLVTDIGSLRLVRFDEDGQGWSGAVDLPGRWARAVVTDIEARQQGVLGIDPAGQAQFVAASGATHVLCPGVIADELAACRTTLDGGRLDVVLRTGHDLRHLAIGRDRHELSAEPIVSQVWL